MEPVAQFWDDQNPSPCKLVAPIIARRLKAENEELQKELGIERQRVRPDSCLEWKRVIKA